MSSTELTMGVAAHSPVVPSPPSPPPLCHINLQQRLICRPRPSLRIFHRVGATSRHQDTAHETSGVAHHNIIRRSMVPNGISCWICLVEGSDDEDRPLVHDCSCRGEDAGFAHLSCIMIMKYDEHKSKQSADNDSSRINTFSNAWVKCPHCNTNYENQLSTDLSTAFAFYAETSFQISSFPPPRYSCCMLEVGSLDLSIEQHRTHDGRSSTLTSCPLSTVSSPLVPYRSPAALDL